ncbi:uncharacterized protein LOC110424106 [Herrania umbratica]|uniref:Uncharacterized protein LOC110424106 n=1 Tax=Herrania umbratica TaxID=108875 RepID=A0A6J1B505_9ROSI|nr:uncharacterized protein LOC110424106 [Herrania umbratica]
MDDFFLVHLPVACSSLLRKFLLKEEDEMNMSKSDFSTTCLLKKAFIVRSIQEGIANGSVAEEILDSLLLIEQVDRKQGLPVFDSMKSAFCAVAVHCTLASLTRSWPCYYDSILRIWRTRIRILEDSASSELVGPDLDKWRKEVEAALWDSEASQRLLRINTRDDALRCLRVFVEEARSSMKPAFLQLTLAAAQAICRPHRGTDKGKGILRVNPQRRCKLGVPHRHYKVPVEIADSKEEQQPSYSKFASLSTSEVNKVQEALKTSTADLLAVVTDPLPKVLEVAEKVASERAGKTLRSEAILEDGNKNKDVPATSVNPTMASAQAERVASDTGGENLRAEAIVEDHSKKGKRVPPPSVNPTKDKSDPPSSVNPTTEPALAKEGNHERQASIHQNEAPRPSLMERNGTARTYEWEDSIDGSSQESSGGSTRCRLPSPKIKPASPLKEYENKKWVRRRKIHRWSLHEEEVLAEAVRKYGSHWAQILRAYPLEFVNRTAGDLKDKWRNMTGK